MSTETIVVELKPQEKKIISMDGQFSSTNPHPQYRFEISATRKSNVNHIVRLIGDKNKYSVVIDIVNNNDSPAFVSIVCE